MGIGPPIMASIVKPKKRSAGLISTTSGLSGATGARTVVHVKARKLHGKEGFAITVGQAEGRRVQWNLGGWGNYQHAVETDDSIVGAPVVAKIEPDRWYDVMIEVDGRRLRCFLDGALISDVILPLSRDGSRHRRKRCKIGRCHPQDPQYDRWSC